MDGSRRNGGSTTCDAVNSKWVRRFCARGNPHRAVSSVMSAPRTKSYIRRRRRRRRLPSTSEKSWEKQTASAARRFHVGSHPRRPSSKFNFLDVCDWRRGQRGRGQPGVRRRGEIFHLCHRFTTCLRSVRLGHSSAAWYVNYCRQTIFPFFLFSSLFTFLDSDTPF